MIHSLRFRGVDFGWEMLNEAGLLVQDYENNEEGEPVPTGDPHLPRNGMGFLNGQRYDIVVLGYLYDDTGETKLNEEGETVPVMDRLWGWHVDLLIKNLPEELEEYVMTPIDKRHVI